MSRSRAILCGVIVVIGCHRGPALAAWTTGEPNAPPDVATVYRAVLDDLFPNPSAPTLIVMDGRAEPSSFEISGKHIRRRPPPLIAPFSYRLPIVFMDLPEEQALNRERMRADSISYTVPLSDIRYRQRAEGPFLEKFPGAWGLVRVSRVRFERGLQFALLDVWYSGVADWGSTHAIFWLAHKDDKWRVIARDAREGLIQPEPVPARILNGWVDALNLTPPARRRVRIVVRDSVSGNPVPSVAILIQAVSVDREANPGKAQGPPGPWMTVFTDLAGEVTIRNPPRGYIYFDAVCPPQRDVAGAPLTYADLNPDAGIDTTLTLRVRMGSCAERAPFMALEAKRHREDVARAKTEAAARAVQGNIHGTIRDASTGRSVPHVPIRVDERGGTGISDSRGHYWLWGFAPGQRKIIVQCPTRRSFLGGKVATSFTIQAPPRMDDTFDINIDMRNCRDPEVTTVEIRTRGVLSIGFEDGFFTPCEPFTQIPLGAYRDWSQMAYLTFSSARIDHPPVWPRIKPVKGYEKIFMDVDADLIGPGSYGHMGIATYLLRVTRIRSASAATKSSCSK